MPSNPAKITRLGLAKVAPERWSKQYSPPSYWRGSEKEAITDKLLALSQEERTPEVINAIIGNTSWTDVRCDQCGECCEEAVIVGEDMDYESNTATLCRECLSRAVDALNE